MTRVPPFSIKVSSFGDDVFACFNTSLPPESSQPGHVQAESFLRSLGVNPVRLAYAKQVHGSTIGIVTSPGNQGECDSFVTAEPGLFLVTSVADCVAVLAWDRRNKVAANIHAGWRGTLASITLKTVELMKNRFGTLPGDVRAYLSPSIGPCCYRVGEDVAGQFDGSFVRRENEDIFLDLWSLNRFQLESAGVSAENIHISGICTFCSTGLFHSFRRDGKLAGRMVSLIGIPDGTIQNQVEGRADSC